LERALPATNCTEGVTTMQTIKKKREDVSQYSDPALVTRARSGDGAAFAAIMTRYNQRLYRVARGIVRDESEAEDVLQEAYVRAFAALSGFRGDSGLGTWLTRIVLNEAFGRMRQRRPTVELEAIDKAVETGDSRVIMFPGADSAPNPEAAAARSEVRRLLEHAIDDLPEAFRLVFVMREIDELSIEETAANLDIRPETVKTRLHRARRLLRKNLDDKLSTVLRDTFPFQGARCARITESVLARLGFRNEPDDSFGGTRGP
jgi:RNA polymerase sigma-70 factor, ECF subfamily